MKVGLLRGVTILYPQGKIAAGGGDVALREAVSDVLEDGRLFIVVDLAAVTTVDSSGLGELVSSWTTVSDRGGKLSLSNVPANVADFLRTARLDTIFFDDEDQAVEAMMAS